MGPAIRGSPVHGAVGELSFPPTVLTTPKRFQQMMVAAEAFEVGGACRPVGPGDGVVEVAVGGGFVAAGVAAGEVAAADEVGQFL